jgi:hypothetical protein
MTRAICSFRSRIPRDSAFNKFRRNSEVLPRKAAENLEGKIEDLMSAIHQVVVCTSLFLMSLWRSMAARFIKYLMRNAAIASFAILCLSQFNRTDIARELLP